jgi:hypothetical protein
VAAAAAGVVAVGAVAMEVAAAAVGAAAVVVAAAVAVGAAVAVVQSGLERAGVSTSEAESALETFSPRCRCYVVMLLIHVTLELQPFFRFDQSVMLV